MKTNTLIAIGQVSEVEIRYRTNVPTSERPHITGSKDAEAILRPYFESEGIEHHETMIMLCLNRAQRVIAVYKLSQGGLAGTVCEPSMIFQCAILTNSAGIILAHNHPSGNLIPSQGDLDITKRVKQAGILLGIKLLDHIILSPENKYYSIGEEGEL